MDRLRVAVLRRLDQEHHEERDDRRPRVDDELPRLREAERGTERGPNEDRSERERETVRRSDRIRDVTSEVRERRAYAHDALDATGTSSSSTVFAIRSAASTEKPSAANTI